MELALETSSSKGGHIIEEYENVLVPLNPKPKVMSKALKLLDNHKSHNCCC